MRNADRFYHHGINPVKGKQSPPGCGQPPFNKYANVSAAKVKRRRLPPTPEHRHPWFRCVEHGYVMCCVRCCPAVYPCETGFIGPFASQAEARANGSPRT